MGMNGDSARSERVSRGWLLWFLGSIVLMYAAMSWGIYFAVRAIF
jgi:hypothetical protein